MISTYVGYQLYGSNIAQSRQRTASEPALKNEQNYYTANIGKVKTVDDFVNNYRLLNYAAKALGISDLAYAKSLLTKVLKSNLSDPKSFANQMSDTRLRTFARSFNFDTTGKVTATLQSTSQQTGTTSLYQTKVSLGTTAATAAAANYTAAMSTISSLADLEKNPTAIATVLVAYGIDPTTASSVFEQTLESDLSDKTSFLNQKSNTGYLALSQAVNVSADGSKTSKTQAQTDAALAAMTSAYMGKAANTTAAQKAASTETSYYISTISRIATVSALVADPRLVAYIDKAFDLPKQATPAAAAQVLTSVLTSDPTDKNGYLRQSPFPNYTAAHKGFNFDTRGTAGSVPFQTSTQQLATTRLFAARQPADSASAAAATAYYNANIGNIHTLSDLQNDPKLWTYIGVAFGLDPTISTQTMASIVSNASVRDSGFLALAQAFNANSDGSAATITVAATNEGISATTAAYAKNTSPDVASQTAKALETNYFMTKVGTLATVADITGDKRLLAYIKKAFALPIDATSAKIQAALTSDTADPSNYANTSGSPGYLALAKAFNFTSAGTAGSADQLVSLTQQQTMAQLYSERGSTSLTVAATETSYFKATIISVKTVADLLKNTRLVSYIETAFGLDAKTDPAAIKAVLQNTSGANTTYLALAQAYQVQSDGTRASSPQAQTYSNLVKTVNNYLGTAASDSAAQQAATTESNYYQAQIGGITSTSQFTADPRLVAYVTKAFALPADATATSIRNALTSNLKDPTSYANKADASYRALAEAYTFDTQGAAISATTIQTSALQNATVTAYSQNQSADSATANAAISYYNAKLPNVKSVGDLVGDTRLLTFIRTAYGLDPKTPAATVAALLENTHNVLDTTKNSSLLAMNQAFNVDAAGNAEGAVTAESSANITATTAAYMANAAPDPISQAAATTATIYYKTTIANVTAVSDLVNDPKLVAYLKQAYKLPPTTKASVIQQILTSDVTNTKSVADTMGSNAETMAAAFNFSATGRITPEASRAQSKAQLDSATNAYIEQQMETEAGTQNPGIALALYLQANASKITDAYSILADKKLSEIFRVILGLSASTSSADIDSQAKTIQAQINLADMKDSKKVDALVQRFSILYDLNPPASTTPLKSSDVFTGSSTTLDTTSLFS